MEKDIKLLIFKTKNKNFPNIKDLFQLNIYIYIYIYIYINKIVVSYKVYFGKKEFTYFIGYRDAKKNGPLCIFLPKMSAYRKDFDETKYISFLIKYYELLEKYNEIWEKS